MIDIRTGQIHVTPTGPIVGPDSDEKEIRKSLPNATRRKERFQLNYQQHWQIFYSCRGMDSLDFRFSLFLRFHKLPDCKKYRLRYVQMNHSFDFKIDSNHDLDKHVLGGKKWHDKWLFKNFGVKTPATYRWGVIKSDFELHTPQPYILIGFK